MAVDRLLPVRIRGYGLVDGLAAALSLGFPSRWDLGYINSVCPRRGEQWCKDNNRTTQDDMGSNTRDCSQPNSPTLACLVV